MHSLYEGGKKEQLVCWYSGDVFGDVLGDVSIHRSLIIQFSITATTQNYSVVAEISNLLSLKSLLKSLA